jgi:hypothetical protein
MPGRIQRERYDYRLTDAVELLSYADLLRQGHVYVQFAVSALEGSERRKALAALRAADEALSECRQRGEQQSLRMPATRPRGGPALGDGE